MSARLSFIFNYCTPIAGGGEAPGTFAGAAALAGEALGGLAAAVDVNNDARAAFFWAVPMALPSVAFGGR